MIKYNNNTNYNHSHSHNHSHSYNNNTTTIMNKINILYTRDVITSGLLYKG